VTSTARGDTGRFIANKITPAVRAAVQASAQFVLQEAQAIVPVDTGELRDSGKTVIVEQDKRIQGMVVFTAEHAAFVEFGTGQRGAASPGAGPYNYSASWPGMPARPYLRPSLDSARDVIRELFKSQIAAEMKF
jgi:HK97 gp10 family phage protein